MGLLVWKDSIKKPMTEEARQQWGLNESGISWIKNMTPEDSKKWIAKLFSKAERIEIQKTVFGADIKIIISKLHNHPKLKRYDEKATKYVKDYLQYKLGVLPNDYLISIGQNGTSIWNIKMIKELEQAISEALTILRNNNG